MQMVAEKVEGNELLNTVTFQNYRERVIASIGTDFLRLSAPTIKSNLNDLSDKALGKHPKKLGGILYLPTSNGGVIWPQNHTELFGWICTLFPDNREESPIDWIPNGKYLTKGEFFEYLKLTAEEATWTEFLQDSPYFTWPTQEESKNRIIAGFKRLTNHDPQIHAEIFFLQRIDPANGEWCIANSIYASYLRWCSNYEILKEDQLSEDALIANIKKIPRIRFDYINNHTSTTANQKNLIFIGIRNKQRPSSPSGS